MESIPQLSLGTALLLIFLVCVLYMLLRGIARMLCGTAMLAASCTVAVLVWQHAPAWSELVFHKPVAAITTGLPIAAFIASLLILRLLLGWIRKPFSDPDAPVERPESPSGFKWVVLFGVAMLPTAILALMAAVYIHHRASIEELRVQGDPKAAMSSKAMRNLGARIGAIMPRKLLAALDPFTSEGHLKLARYLASRPAGDYPPVIDPATGKPIPRAIPVEDPELQRLVQRRDFGALLRHPAMAEALKNPEVRKMLEKLEK